MLDIRDPEINRLATHMADTAGTTPVEAVRSVLRGKMEYAWAAARALNYPRLPGDPERAPLTSAERAARLGFGGKFHARAAVPQLADSGEAACACTTVLGLICDAEIGALVHEAAGILGTTPLEALRMLLRAEVDVARRTAEDLEWLEQNIWSKLPPGVRGVRITKEEREEILGYGPNGY